MVGGFNNIKGQYTTVGSQAWDSIKGGSEKNQDELKKIGSMIKTSGEMVNSQKEDINYYAFTAGYLVKGLLKKLPIVAMDSAMEAYWGSNGNQFLSVQKFVNILSSDKFKETFATVAAQVMAKKTTIENMTSQDADGFWKVIREIGGSKSSINSWLEKVKKNASGLEENYCNATKLLLHLMVGKSELEGLQTKIEELKGKVETMKTLLKSIKDLGEPLISNLETQLDNLKNNSDTFKDPCPKTKSS